MATQSLRNALTSPVRAVGAQRSILKRPAPLALSPRLQVASFSVMMSPSSQVGLKSPHVHFPPSPSKMVATITTYSPSSYDRGAISVSPNPLNMPGWGERVWSPSSEGFKLAVAPKVFRSLTMAYQPSPVITDFEDPRSPKLKLQAKTTSNVIRFDQMTTNGPTKTSKPLEHSLSSYPRSPYPSAGFEMETRGRQMSRTTPEEASSRARARASSVQARETSRRNKKGLTLSGPVASARATSFTPIPSPLSRNFVTTSTAKSTLNRANKPAPLALDSESAGSDQLSNAFWNSMSVDASAAESVDGPMVTALEYPESATMYEEKIDIEIRSAAQPPLMFAGANGVLFSPGLPKPRAAVDKIRASLDRVLMSPGVKRTSFVPIARKEITAPSPNDPFAAFPSFGAALEASGLQYPAPVAQAA